MGEVPSAAQMLEDAAWLKRLATTLAQDNDDADDLVQESWIAAWRRSPDSSRPMRPWLAKVIRDVAGMKRRSERRRAAREVIAENTQAPAAPDELLEQMRLHRLLVDLVLELDEPYRSTVTARFVEGRTSASIARSLDIPEGTVRKRLHEALSRLRAGLDARSGDRKRWAPAVLAFAKGGIQVAKPTKLVIAVLVPLLLVAAATLILMTRSSSQSATRSGSATPAATGASEPSRVAPSDSPSAHVTVTVIDAAGPIANAVVRCASPDGDVIVTQTASDGTAAVTLAAGEWLIAASADGREPAATTVAAVVGRDARVSLLLAVGGRTLTGTVSDATGGPVPGARVDAARLEADTKPGRAVAVAFTDGAGRYKLTLGGGQILVAASHPEYAPQTRYADLGANGATANFALVPGGVIEGVVRELESKQPVAGASVLATHDASALELADSSDHVTRSDADGKFRIAGLRPGSYELSAREGSRTTRMPIRVALGVAEQQTDLHVFVAAAAAIRGKVLDEAGAAARGVTVSASGGNGVGGSAISDEAGGFAIDGLAPGRWILRGTSERYLRQGLGMTSVELKTSDVDGVVVHVQRGLEVKGRVDPREICDVSIENHNVDPMTRHDSMTTNDTGEFRFAPVALGKVTLSARCPNGDEGGIDVVVDADTRDQILAVKSGASIAGHLLDTSGKPIVGVTVTAEPSSDQHLTTIVNGAVTSGFRAITSTGGAFEMRGLDATTYRLTALDRGRPMKSRKAAKVSLAPAQHATGVDLVVERPSGVIRGTVNGPDGAPVADAWVALEQKPEDMLESMESDDADAPEQGRRSVFFHIDGTGAGDVPPALTDARGHFEMSNVPHGRFQVIAEARAGALRGRAADVTPDAEIAIQLASVGSLRGTVHGARGPTDVFEVHLEGPTSDDRSFIEGAFEFPRVDPGDYTIEVTSSAGTGRATARLVAGSVASVDIALVANATVTGRLVDKTGKPLAGQPIVLVPDHDQVKIDIHGPPQNSGPDGRFQVDGQAGTMRLVVLGHTPALTHGHTRGLLLEPGKTLDIGDVTLDE